MPTVFSNPTLVPAIVAGAIDMTSVNGLPAALAGKAAASHTHLAEQVTDLDDVLAALPAGDLTEVEASIAAIEETLAGKADTSHTHTEFQNLTITETLDVQGPVILESNNITMAGGVASAWRSEMDVPTTEDLALKADASHVHEPEDVNGLTAYVHNLVPPPIWRDLHEGPPLSGNGVNSIVVSGIEFDPPITAPLAYVDEYLGRNRFGVLSSSGANCYWTGSAWRFYNWGAIWESEEDVAYPWLVQSWVPQAPTVGAGLRVDSLMEGTLGVPGQVAIHGGNIYQCVNIQPSIWEKIAKASEVMGI